MVDQRYLSDEVGHGQGTETRRGPGSVCTLGGSRIEGGPATEMEQEALGQARPGTSAWRPSGQQPGQGVASGPRGGFPRGPPEVAAPLHGGQLQ